MLESVIYFKLWNEIFNEIGALGDPGCWPWLLFLHFRQRGYSRQLNPLTHLFGCVPKCVKLGIYVGMSCEKGFSQIPHAGVPSVCGILMPASLMQLNADTHADRGWQEQHHRSDLKTLRSLIK